CFFKINPKVQQAIGYSWAGILFTLRLSSVIFGPPQPSIMCYGARVIMPFWKLEHYGAMIIQNAVPLLGGTIIVLGLISVTSQRFNHPLPFKPVDSDVIKRAFAIAFPTAALIFLQRFTIEAQYPWDQELLEFNARILFSSCHFGSIATLLILVNHFQTLRQFIVESILCHKKERIDLS
ncbi:hypothetical protein PENTCL1PPCAC_6106, partial [Pristionchus entomophagus]